MQRALGIMEEGFPCTVRWTRPTGGYTIWAKTSKGLNETRLHEFMSESGVFVSRGRYYFSQKKPSKYFRVSIASANEEKFYEGIARPGEVVHALS